MNHCLRKYLRLGLFVFGFILMIVGQLFIWQTDRTLEVFNKILRISWQFNQMWYGILPIGIVFGIAFFLLGAILVAAVIQHLELKKNPLRGELLFSFNQRNIYITSVFLIGASIFLMLPSEPGTAAAIVWFITLIFFGAVFFIYDQFHKTTLGNPFFSWGELIRVSLITVFGLILVVFDMTSWRWSGTPDELCFYGIAREIGEQGLNQFILSQKGLFGYHPVLSHLYQLVIMKLFGMNIFGWRLSSALAFAFAIPFVYLLARDLWNKRTGYIAAALFTTAPIALVFAHAGYNNIHVYPIIAASLAMFTWSSRRNSVFGYYLTGIIAGLGFYTYYPARLAGVFVILLGFLSRALPLIRKNRLVTVGFILGFGITILYPLMNLGELLQAMLQFTVVKDAAESDAGGILRQLFAPDGFGKRILINFVYTLIHGIYTVQGEPNWHFLRNPVLNPVYSAFFLMGFWITIAKFFKNHSSCFLVISFSIAALTVGGVADYEAPPLTRLMFFAPFLAIFAAIAVDQLWLFLSEKLEIKKYIAAVIGIILVVTMAVWNIGDLYYNVYHIYHGFNLNVNSEIVRLRQMLPKNYNMVYIHTVHYYSDAVPWTRAYDGLRQRSFCFGGLDNFEYDFDQALKMLQTIKPPFMVVLNLEDEYDKITAVKELLEKRFPEMNLDWELSDPDQDWNMEYVFVPPLKQ